MIMKIAKVTNSMAEFYQFYHSLLEFKLKRFIEKFNRLMRINRDKIDLEPIVIEQFEKPIISFLYLNGIAAIVFIAEILVFKWLNWRNCKLANNFKLNISKCNRIYMFH